MKAALLKLQKNNEDWKARGEFKAPRWRHLRKWRSRTSVEKNIPWIRNEPNPDWIRSLSKSNRLQEGVLPYTISDLQLFD